VRNIDSTNHGTDFILMVDAKALVASQEYYDSKEANLIGRKMTKSTYEKVFLKEAEKNNIVLDVYRDDETGVILKKEHGSTFVTRTSDSSLSSGDSYSVGGESNAS